MESDRPVGASFFLLEIVLAQTPSTDDSLTLTPETAFSYEADCQPGEGRGGTHRLHWPVRELISKVKVGGLSFRGAVREVCPGLLDIGESLGFLL